MLRIESEQSTEFVSGIVFHVINRNGRSVHKADTMERAEEFVRKDAARKAKAKLSRREKDDIMSSLGLTKVRGSVSGKVYYE